jgi:hypothetical protein
VNNFSPDKINEKADLKLVKGKYMSAAIYESKYIFNSPNQSNDRRASGFGVITSFETALSPVNSDTSSKLCKPELLS